MLPSTLPRTSLLRPLLMAGCLALTSCGGGGGAQLASGNATVGIALTDAPVGAYDEVLATITSIQLLGSGSPVTIFSGNETLDLLKLGDYAELFAVSEEVPPGQYDKIRLQVTGIELIDRDANGDVVETVDAQVVANGKLDLNPQGPFTIAPAETLVIALDFDVAKSLKVTTTGSGRVIVRPVIFVDIRPGVGGAKLTRVHGTVDAVLPDGSFRLCQTAIVAQGETSDGVIADERCVRVATDAATGLFGTDGLPRDTVLMPDEPVTVVGRLRPLSPGEADDGDGVDEPADDDRFGLSALVIEAGALGSFKRWRGTVAGAVDVGTDRFDLGLAPGQGVLSAAPLATQLFAKSRVFSRTGVELTRSAIESGRAGIVDAVLALGLGPAGSNLLRAPLVVLDLAPAGSDVAGSIVDRNVAAGTVTVDADGVARCVDARTADVFVVGAVGDSFESRRGSFDDQAIGRSIAAFGTAGASCLIARTIIVQTG